jgi:Carboxypeptidase regulatory-like domain
MMLGISARFTRQPALQTKPLIAALRRVFVTASLGGLPPPKNVGRVVPFPATKMKVIMLSLVLILQRPTAVPVGQTISGTIRLAGSSEPLKEVAVTLAPINALSAEQLSLFGAVGPGVQLSPAHINAINAINGGLIRQSAQQPNARSWETSRNYRSLTNDAGRFEFRNVAPGRYSIAIRRVGHFNPGDGGGAIAITSPIDIGQNIQIPELSLTLAREGVITGRVLNPAGQLVAGVSVSAFRRRYQNGRIVLDTVTAVETNDRGEYRLFSLGPGEYWVAATPRRNGLTTAGRDSWIRTYFPSATDLSKAASVKVASSEIPAINIQMQAAPMVTVTGQVKSVVGEVGLRVAEVHMAAIDTDVAVEVQPHVNRAADKANGGFEIPNVAPGSYELIASIIDSQGHVLPPLRTQIEVGSESLRGVSLSFQPRVDVKVRVNYAGGVRPENSPPVRVQIIPRDFDLAPPTTAEAGSVILTQVGVDGVVTNEIAAPGGSAIDQDGVRTFRNVAQGRYVFQLTGMSPHAFVKDIREGGVSIFDSGLVVGPTPPDRIEVVINPVGETVLGTVVDSAGRPISSATVVLAPPLMRRENHALYKVAVSGQDGRFSIYGLAPEAYRLFAWESGLPSLAYLNAEFMAQFESHGLDITISSGTPANPQVVAIKN